mmetsp:Transcript_10589/g.65173  ORF Transcript_10589/g.65173 Transcript_10589/m.65173 type:complete len:370 (-) Transcript_10589:10829-11938(-)
MRVSRHYLSDRLACVQWLPRPPVSWNDDGEVADVQTHPLVAAVGARLGVLHLQVPQDARRATQLSWIDAWDADAPLTDVCAWEKRDVAGASCDDDPSKVTLVLATSRGGLATLRVDAWESQARAKEDVSTDANVVRMGAPHVGRVAKVDVHGAGESLLSAGADGRVCAWERSAPDRPHVVVDARHALSFVDVRGSTRDTWITASVDGATHAWDRRHSSRRPTCTLPWHVDGSTVRWESRCLHVDPPRPHLCYAGSRDGTVLMWDLRAPRAPFRMRPSHVASHALGDVWCVTSDPTSHPPDVHVPTSPTVWYVTQGGGLHVGGWDGPSATVYEEGAPLRHVCVDPHVRRRPRALLCTDHRTLVVVGSDRT